MLLSRNYRVFFHVIVFLGCITDQLLANTNAKRNGARNNYEMCLESFYILHNKIIRTQDSREMGAVYLNVSDVDTRDDCLKFCCTTELCDVFIFEEKKPGSCYLFQCGPLYDFKCKFTDHANYSSAVRTNHNVHSNPNAEEDVQISQQEHELKSLRFLYPYTESSVKLVTTLTPKLIPTPAPPPKQACTRNQYECRSTGECIAIYNVCDGIAQCADGSDEAADLVCPTDKPTVSSSAAMQGSAQQPVPLSPFAPYPPEIRKSQQIMEEQKALNPLYPHDLESQNPRPWELPNLAGQVMSQPGLPYPGQQIEVPQMRKEFNNRYQWDYPPTYDQNNEVYNNPANSLRMQNNLNNYEQNQPHIFNHKGSGVIGDSESDNMYVDTKHSYASRFSPTNRGSWHGNQAVPFASEAPNTVYKPNKNEVAKNITTTAVPCDVTHTEKNEETKVPEESKSNPKLEKTHREKLASQEKGNSKSLKSEETQKLNHVQIKEQRAQHKSSVIVIEEHSREHGGKSTMAEHFRQETENVVLRPKGAVISLALGLTVTAITAALIACRLRVVKRRGRRGHGPYAHDADYLVNGMYL